MHNVNWDSGLRDKEKISIVITKRYLKLTKQYQEYFKLPTFLISRAQTTGLGLARAKHSLGFCDCTRNRSKSKRAFYQIIYAQRFD
jgi:hypothetical protein